MHRFGDEIFQIFPAILLVSHELPDVHVQLFRNPYQDRKGHRSAHVTTFDF